MQHYLAQPCIMCFARHLHINVLCCLKKIIYVTMHAGNKFIPTHIVKILLSNILCYCKNFRILSRFMGLVNSAMNLIYNAGW